MDPRCTLPLLLTATLPFFFSGSLKAQGCSDAGVCTAGPIGELHLMGDTTIASEEPRHMARLTFSFGAGEQGTTIMQVVPEISLGLTEEWGVQFKVPYQSTSGNLGENSGSGDATLTTSYRFLNTKQQRLNAIIGAKFPANNADASSDGKPLPMPYQTSLGTTDLLLGLNYRFQRWSATVAYQHVLDQGNENGFDHVFYPDDADAAAYFESFDLVRANDLVIRGQYAFKLGGLLIQPGLLAIMHLAEDKRTDPLAESGSTEISIEGSDGLTLNLTADARYKLSDHWAMEASFGTPLVVRTARPDGLTRSLVLNLGLAYHFGS